MNTNQIYDVLIIGGSYAGLSAALALGRTLRRVLVLDAGQPANRQTFHAHGFLTRDGETPAQLTAIARKEVSRYPGVSFYPDTALTAEQVGGRFQVTTAGGVTVWGRKLLLATGLTDIMPDLPGFADCWGRSVLHCPYCHGYEVHGRPLGLFGNGDAGYELASLLRNWTDRLTLFTNGPPTLAGDQRQLLANLGVSVVETPVVAIDHQAGILTALRLADGSEARPAAVFARVPFRQSSDLPRQLGCPLTEQGLIDATEFGETSVAGVFAAGDSSTLLRQLAVAVAAGAKAGAWINRALVAEGCYADPIRT